VRIHRICNPITTISSERIYKNKGGNKMRRKNKKKILKKRVEA